MDIVKRTKNLYKVLQKDNESVLFANEKVTDRALKKVRKSNYEEDKEFLKLYNRVKNVNIQ